MYQPWGHSIKNSLIKGGCKMVMWRNIADLGSESNTDVISGAQEKKIQYKKVENRPFSLLPYRMWQYSNTRWCEIEAKLVHCGPQTDQLADAPQPGNIASHKHYSKCVSVQYPEHDNITAKSHECFDSKFHKWHHIHLNGNAGIANFSLPELQSGDRTGVILHF